MLPTVTSGFIKEIIRSGRLTESRLRFEAGEGSPADWNFATKSCWSIVCEEVLDTDHETKAYDAIYAELIRRRFSPDEIDEMRRLAWKTAGWMNYDLMLWEWVSLDEDDMRRALSIQLEKRKIGKTEYEEAMQSIELFLKRDPRLGAYPEVD